MLQIDLILCQLISKMQQSRKKRTKFTMAQFKPTYEQSCLLRKNKFESYLSTRGELEFEENWEYFKASPAFRPANKLVTLKNHHSFKQARINKFKDYQTNRLQKPEFFQNIVHRSSQSLQSRSYASSAGKGKIIFLKAKTINPVENFVKAKSLTPAKRSFNVRTSTPNKKDSNCFQIMYAAKSINSLDLKDIKLEASKHKSKIQELIDSAQQEEIKGWSFKYLRFQTESQMP